MKTLQDYIDKLNALNFKDMYNSDFFLTWEKTDDELEAVFTLADALRFMRENNISVTIPHVPASHLLPHVTCSDLRCRIWMKENRRLRMVRRFVRQPT